MLFRDDSSFPASPTHEWSSAYLYNHVYEYKRSYVYNVTSLNRRICSWRVFEEALHMASQRILHGNETGDCR